MEINDGMKLQFKVIGALIILCGFIFLFQNCGKTAVSFSPVLTSGPIDSNGMAVTQDAPPVPTPTASSSPSPSPSPSPSVSPSAAGDELCIIANAGNQGENNKVGFDQAVQYLASVHAVPQAVCLSSNGCLNMVNDYLNLTHGVVGGPVGAPLSPKVQFTQQKDNGVCAHNPNVLHMSDEQLAAEIRKLMP